MKLSRTLREHCGSLPVPAIKGHASPRQSSWQCVHISRASVSPALYSLLECIVKYPFETFYVHIWSRGRDHFKTCVCTVGSHDHQTPRLQAEVGVCLLVGCLTSRQHASVSQGRICSDNFTCCHTEIEVADPTFYLTQSQYTDTGSTSPSADSISPGAWQGSH